MNKIKKLHKGMSLVEVLVAMTVFSVGAAAVTMAFSTAVKYNTHNQRRDDELAIQQAAIQNGKNDGLELYGTSAGNDYEIVYKVRGGSKITYKDKDDNEINPYVDATEFQAAKSGKNDTIFDFQLKSFSTTPVDSSDIVVASKDQDEYKVIVKNESAIPYDVRVDITCGTIYLGSYSGDGYKHSSPVYRHSLAPQMTNYDLKDKDGNPTPMVPAAFEFGYKCDGLASLEQMDSPMKISFYKEGYFAPDREYTLRIDKMTGESASGKVELIIEDNGKVRIEYPA
jgi:prepilin-type N-terminal cleavage/methylation domain-containing protein